MTTPVQRIQRLLDEGAIIRVQIPGQVSIDLTPDIIALLSEVQSSDKGFKPERNLFEPLIAGRDVPTRVQFP
jgi:hypothetical protein